MSNSSIGLQLYTVRDQTQLDFKKTVQRVAEMGYDAVEFAGYGDIPSKEMSALLADTGLRTAGSHVSLDALEHDLDHEINYCLDIGCPYLIIPYLAQEWRTAAGFLKLADRLNILGRHCQNRGITLAYHNHNFEFEQEDGRYLLDLLAAATDPQLVKLELDTYWAAYAGVDPIAYLRTITGRVALVHLKDMTPDRHFTEVGDGTLDIKGYCQAARAAGARFYLVENDQPTIPSLESARRSLENLRTILS